MTSKKIRVLHVLGSMNPGGVETWLMQVLRRIDRSRFELHFCTFGPEPGLYASQVEELGGKIIPCVMRKNVWSLSQRFRKILRAGRYDVVHSHVHLFSGAVLRWAHAEGVPMRIAHSHTTNDGKRTTPLRSIYRTLMKRWIEHYATHKLAASKAAGANLFRDGSTSRRCEVLHCGIDLHAFELPVDSLGVRREFGIPGNAPVVGHVGRFDEPKNHQFLLRIAQEVLAKRPDVHFLLVGDGPLRSTIDAQARAFGLSKQMHFVGRRMDVPRLMCGAMDIFLFPSRWEGLPLVLVETQAAGLLAFVSDHVTREVAVAPGLVKYVSLSAGPSAWAELVVDSLNNRPLETASTLTYLRNSDFNIEHGRTNLAAMYSKVLG